MEGQQLQEPLHPPSLHLVGEGWVGGQSGGKPRCYRPTGRAKVFGTLIAILPILEELKYNSSWSHPYAPGTIQIGIVGLKQEGALGRERHPPDRFAK